MSLHSQEVLTTKRANASNPENLDKYFDVLEATLQKNGSVPRKIWNLDETGLSISGLYRRRKVLAKRGRKQSYLEQGKM